MIRVGLSLLVLPPPGLRVCLLSPHAAAWCCGWARPFGTQRSLACTAAAACSVARRGCISAAVLSRCCCCRCCWTRHSPAEKACASPLAPTDAFGPAKEHRTPRGAEKWPPVTVQGHAAQPFQQLVLSRPALDCALLAQMPLPRLLPRMHAARAGRVWQQEASVKVGGMRLRDAAARCTLRSERWPPACGSSCSRRCEPSNSQSGRGSRSRRGAAALGQIWH